MSPQLLPDSAAPARHAWRLVRFGSHAVDRESAEVGRRAHLRGIELDHPIVHSVADSGHGADGSVVFGALGDDWGAGSTAVTGGETDQLAGVIVADGGQGAIASINDDACAASQHDLVVSVGGGTQ